MELLHATIADLLVRYPGEKIIVAGHSRGAQIIGEGLREMKVETRLDRSRILLISSGNPERRYGGVVYMRPDLRKPAYPGTGGPGVGYGLPLSGTTYGFIPLDIALQYDEWADFPNDPGNTMAKTAIGKGNLHSEYYKALPLGADGLPINIDDWGHFTIVTTTYLTSPTNPPPGFTFIPPMPTFRELAFRGVRTPNEEPPLTQSVRRCCRHYMEVVLLTSNT